MPKDSNVQPSENRSAEMYVDAVNAAISLVDLAIPYIPQGGKAAVVANAVKKAVPAMRAAADQIPKVAPVVAPAVKKVADGAAQKLPEAVGTGVGKAADTVRGVADAAGGIALGAHAKVRDSLDVRAQEKARKLARKTLLDGAGIRLSSEKFLDNWKMQEKISDSKGTYLAYSGCYVVITCDNAVRKDDYSKYRDLYVGKSSEMGKSIYNDFVGKGNPDVYADVKYKQHVYVLLYPCANDKLDELEQSLITALDADDSYNRVL